MNEIPATLGEAIGSEPAWLTAWLMVLGGIHFVAIVFTVFREEDRWRFRWEPIGIIASFFLAGVIMSAMYDHYGYVRLLGLAHIIGWLPIYGWLLYRRREIGFSSAWGWYVHWYLAIAGTSLVIDAIDTIRYLVGDDASLYLRWAGG